MRAASMNKSVSLLCRCILHWVGVYALCGCVWPQFTLSVYFHTGCVSMMRNVCARVYLRYHDPTIPNRASVLLLAFECMCVCECVYVCVCGCYICLCNSIYIPRVYLYSHTHTHTHTHTPNQTHWLAQVPSSCRGRTPPSVKDAHTAGLLVWVHGHLCVCVCVCVNTGTFALLTLVIIEPWW